MSGRLHPWRLTGRQSKGGSWAGVPRVSGVRPRAAAMTGEEINGPSSKLARNERAHSCHPLAGLQTELRSSVHLSRAHAFSHLICGVRQS